MTSYLKIEDHILRALSFIKPKGEDPGIILFCVKSCSLLNEYAIYVM